MISVINIFRYGLTSLLITLPLMLQALDSDKEQPLNITSNWAKFNRKTNVAVYVGDVVMDQGSTHLTADRVVAYFNKSHRLLKAVAHGKIVHYRTLPEMGKPQMFAVAKTMKYFWQQHKIVLIKDAMVDQGSDHFTGPRLIYDTRNDIIRSVHKDQQRTTVILDTV